MGQSNDDPTRHRRFSISCRSPIIAQLPQPAITGKATAALGAANLHSCALLNSVRQISHQHYYARCARSGLGHLSLCLRPRYGGRSTPKSCRRCCDATDLVGYRILGIPLRCPGTLHIDAHAAGSAWCDEPTSANYATGAALSSRSEGLHLTSRSVGMST